MVNAAIESGINFFDTADMYGGGQSEEYLGRALKGRRDKVLIATKFGMKMAEGKEGGKPAYIRQAAEDSLRRLGTDHIDLYQIHKPDPSTPIADTLGALDELVKAGKVREIGCSNFSAEQLREAAQVKPGARFVSVQNNYSLLHREPEAEVLPECQRLGIAFLPYFPLANGLLTGKYRKGQPFPKSSRAEDGFGPKVFTEENLALVEKLRRICGIARAHAAGAGDGVAGCEERDRVGHRGSQDAGAGEGQRVGGRVAADRGRSGCGRGILTSKASHG